MTTILELRVRPEVAYDAARLRSAVAENLGIAPREITQVRIVRRSIDARQRNVMVNLGVQIWVGEQPAELAYTPIRYGDVSQAPQAVVVGAGPAGLFAALRLIELGVRPVVLERGRDVDGRKKDIAAIARSGSVDPESNYSFGEGGAGAFSDGKLYTRSKKRGNVARILGIFCQYGAATDILADAIPTSAPIASRASSPACVGRSSSRAVKCIFRRASTPSSSRPTDGGWKACAPPTAASGPAP